MSTFDPPRRSLVHAQIVSDGIELGCDCGQTVGLIIEPWPSSTYQDAWICDGCGSVHWYTLLPKLEGDKP